ncbi:hypothetical protein [Sphingobium lignivorans]|uniref:Uncharacterized protein n=1 Tax=Sphingobium lignivorans TaxID=2735886 RepID=A0ABR6NK58_9SPHN|nr:hypothetical protein [Sphingobium lignivorans]MBB5987641.1 hypothetical protein [Sphingobium lignivorans]
MKKDKDDTCEVKDLAQLRSYALTYLDKFAFQKGPTHVYRWIED